jgi:hypothetical protein
MEKVQLLQLKLHDDETGWQKVRHIACHLIILTQENFCSGNCLNYIVLSISFVNL